MSLSDPFGRVGRRQSRAYAALRGQLQAQGIESPPAVAAVAARMARSASLWILVTVLSCTVAIVLFGELRGVIAVLGTLAVLWVGVNWFQARLHLRRYLRELTPANPSHDEGEQP